MRSGTSSTSLRGTNGSGLSERGTVRDFVFRQAFGNLAAHDVQAVTETFGHDQAGFGSGASDQRVIADGAGVKKQAGRALKQSSASLRPRLFAASATEFSAPWEKSSGVESDFADGDLPSSSTTTQSVNVPPISTPTT